MEFINETDCPAELFRSEFEEDVMYNSLLARIRYRIVNNSELVPLITGEGALEDIRRDRVEDEYGIIEPDIFFPRTGTDVIVIGDAVSPKGPVKAMAVRVAVGPYDQTLHVFGDRVWEKRFGSRELVPSEPIAFETMPISYQYAYGGSTKTEYGDLAYYNNPVGKGYYLKKEDAVGQPLPNIEDPKNSVKKWEDQPDPLGIAPYPFNWGLRLTKVVSVDEKTEQIDLNPENGMFDRAHPALSGKQVEAGHTVTLQGFNPKSVLRFEVPECPLVVRIELGDNQYTREFLLEEIFIDLRMSVIDFSYRKVFDYRFEPHQKRCATVTWKKLRC